MKIFLKAHIGVLAILILSMTYISSLSQTLLGDLDWFLKNDILGYEFIPDSTNIPDDHLHLKFNPEDSTFQWFMRKRPSGRSLKITERFKFDSTGNYHSEYRLEYLLHDMDSLGRVVREDNILFEYDSLNRVIRKRLGENPKRVVEFKYVDESEQILMERGWESFIYRPDEFRTTDSTVFIYSDQGLLTESIYYNFRTKPPERAVTRFEYDESSLPIKMNLIHGDRVWQSYSIEYLFNR